MPNLMDQMNILKGLSDQTLGTEMQTPSGAVPPFLVLSEINRRKDMRQRYAGQMAQQKPRTTVMQDEMAAMPPPPQGMPSPQGAPMPPQQPQAQAGIGGAPPPMMPPGGGPPAGIAAAPPQGYHRGGLVRGYYSGGPVTEASTGTYPDAAELYRQQLAATYGSPTDAASPTAVDPGAAAAAATAPPMDIGIPSSAVTTPTPAIGGPDYASITAGYQKQLEQEQSARARAPWLGLMQAGLAMAGGTSPNALTNIGQGGAAGLNAYGDYMKSANAGTSDALKGLSGVQAQQRAEQMQALNYQLEQQKLKDAENPDSPQNTPAIMREIQQINAMPDGTPEEAAAKADAMSMIQPFAKQTAKSKADQADIIAQGIHNGDVLPPTTLGMGGQGAAIQASFLRQFPGESLAQLQLDAKAANAWVTHMNSNQIVKQQANLSVATDQLSKLGALADQWKAGNYPVLNSANFKLALAGGEGPDAQSLASQFQQQLADTKLTMQQVFAGGYAGTDKQLAEIDNMFTTASPNKTFDDLINLARLNVGYRVKALTSPEAVGVGGLGANAFAPRPDTAAPGATPAPPGTPTPPGTSAAVTGPAHVANDADYQALPSGTEFIGPDGQIRKKP